MKRFACKLGIACVALACVLLICEVGFAQEPRTWCVDFGDKDAKAGGGKIVFEFKLKSKDGQVITRGLTFKVPGPWKPLMKAQELETHLKKIGGKYATITRVNQIVCITVKKDLSEDTPFVDIVGGKITERTTGETGVRIFDNATETYPEIVTFNIEGTPIDPEGEAILKLGLDYPLVSVSTYGKSPAEIKSELTTLFNSMYGGTGFVATIDCGNVMIPEVPCSLGVTGGADDSVLTWTLVMEDPDVYKAAPAHSPLGLILLMLAVAGFFGYMILRRRRAVLSNQ